MDTAEECVRHNASILLSDIVLAHGGDRYVLGFIARNRKHLLNTATKCVCEALMLMGDDHPYYRDRASYWLHLAGLAVSTEACISDILVALSKQDMA